MPEKPKDDKSVSKPVERKGKTIKFVTPDLLVAAMESEDNVALRSSLRFVDDFGNELTLPLDRNCYWLFAKNKKGEYADYFTATDDETGEGNVEHFKEFMENLGMETEVWYIGRGVGLRRVS